MTKQYPLTRLPAYIRGYYPALGKGILSPELPFAEEQDGQIPGQGKNAHADQSKQGKEGYVRKLRLCLRLKERARKYPPRTHKADHHIIGDPSLLHAPPENERHGDGAGNEGECAWYAVRRTNEILASYGKTARVTSGGNGADFCYAPDYQQFTSTTNVDEIQPGDVVSWGGGNGHSYGHVAVIEVVYRDASGKVTSALTSEGGNSFGSGYGTYYKGHYVDNSYIWGLSSGSYKNEVRAYNCEGPTGLGTGCQNFRVRTRAQLMAPSSSYRLNCFIHLVG